MPPQAKRRRSSSASPEESKDKESLDISKLKQHEKLWMEDGSIVLATDVHLYRVHKSILARNSSVFKDMLDFPTVEKGPDTDKSASVDRWDGLPLVRMVGDDDESVFHLLMTLYDREYFHAGKPVEYSVFLSLLKLSTKYDFSAIQREAVRQIERVYPSESSKWSRRVIDAFCREAGQVPDDFDFLLLAAARQCDVHIAAPVLFYECAVNDLDVILKFSNKVTSEDFKGIIVGRERLTKYAYEFGSSALHPKEKCKFEACSEVRMELFMNWLCFDQYDPPLFPLDACALGLEGIGEEEERVNICHSCRKKSSLSLKGFRDTLWKDLPYIFELGDWDDIKSATSDQSTP